MLGSIGGLAKSALEGGLLDNLFKVGGELLDSVFKTGNNNPFNAGANGANGANNGLLHTCNHLNGGSGANGIKGGGLQNFLNVAKSLIEQFAGDDANVDKATNNADAKTSEIKGLLEKLVAAFEKLTENKTPADNASGNQAQNLNQAGQANQAAGSQAAGAADAAEAADNQDPLQQITDLLKKLLEVVTGQKAEGSENAAGNSASGANGAGNQAAEAANAQNPLQQIAEMLQKLLDEVKKLQGEEATNSAAAGNNADQTGSANQAQSSSQAEGANQASNAAQNAAAPQASAADETDGASNEDALQQILGLLQKLVEGLQNANGVSQSATAANASGNNAQVQSSAVKTPSDFGGGSFSMVATSRFEAYMSERV